MPWNASCPSGRKRSAPNSTLPRPSDKAKRCCCSCRLRVAARYGALKKYSHEGTMPLNRRNSAVIKLFSVPLVLFLYVLCFALEPAHSQEREKLRVSTL